MDCHGEEKLGQHIDYRSVAIHLDCLHNNLSTAAPLPPLTLNFHLLTFFLTFAP